MPKISDATANRWLDRWYSKELQREADEAEMRELNTRVNDWTEADMNRYVNLYNEIDALQADEQEIVQALKNGHAFGL